MDKPTGNLVIKNGNVLLADGSVAALDVLVENGIITELGHALDARTRIDADGHYVLPGLIDLHTHGIGFQSVAAGNLAEYAAIEASRGATTFYPSLFAPPEEAVAQMRQHRRETDDLRLTPQVAGFRLESPYLAYTGAGLSKDLAQITSETTQMLLEAGGGHIKIWDISPELPGAPEAISQLSADGVVCSIAHTRATIEQGMAVVDAGARFVTHLFNVFVQPEVTEAGCYPAGLVDYLLTEDRLTCEIVGDGTHVPSVLVEKAFRCKTAERLAFITDSNLGASLAPGVYDLPGGWGRAAVDGPNNGVRLVDREMGLAGSALTPIDAFRNVIRLFHKDLATASRVCSATPARLMGLNKGEITVGRDGDLIILDRDLELLHTVVGGRIV